MKMQSKTFGFLAISAIFALPLVNCGGGSTHAAKEDVKNVDSEEDLPARCSADDYDMVCVQATGGAYTCDLNSGKWVVDPTKSCNEKASSSSGKSSSSAGKNVSSSSGTDLSSSSAGQSSSSEESKENSSSSAEAIFSFDDVNLDFLIDYGTYFKQADGEDGRNIWTGTSDEVTEAWQTSLENALTEHEYEFYEEDNSWHLEFRSGHTYGIKVSIEGSTCTFTIHRL